jgi:hypothetical protein
MMNLFVRQVFVAIFLVTYLSSYTQEVNRSSKNVQKEAKRKARQEKISNFIRQQEEGALVFNNQHIYGFRLNTDGWGVFYEYAKMRSVKVANTFGFEFAEKKHPKEKKMSDIIPLSGNVGTEGNPFVYGKQNIFYQLKPSFGQQRMIGAKANKNGIALHWIYSGGISLGFLRPYYINVIYREENFSYNEKTDLFNAETLAQFDNLYPRGYWFEGTGLKYGWDEMKIVPGLHAKSGLRFDYGRFNELVSAIEVGLNAEYYFNDIQILVNNDPLKFFFNAYVAILIGKRN